MGEERQGGTEDERKSSTPDQSTALLGKERTLLRILSFLLSFLLKLSFCFPACHSRGRKFRERERERNSRFHETDGKLSVRLCFERVYCATVNRIFLLLFSLVWKSKFVWEGMKRESESLLFFLRWKIRFKRIARLINEHDNDSKFHFSHLQLYLEISFKFERRFKISL